MRVELERALAGIGLPCSQPTLEIFCRYYEILISWNQRVNLTALCTPEDFIYKHVCDSLLPAIIFPQAMSSLVDVGTGAGFPGLPIKIALSGVKLTLVEAAAKKVAFLQYCCRELGVEAEIVGKRAETLGQGEGRGAFAGAITRAVSGLTVVCEYCLPLLAVGGCLLALRGPQGEKEAQAAKKAFGQLGGRLLQVYPYRLPTGDPRCLVVVEKFRPTPAAYPRRPGIPAKRPL